MCDCRATINRELEKHNARLSFCFSVQDSELDAHPYVLATERVARRKRFRPPLVLASYCPFCGEKRERKVVALQHPVVA